MSFLRMLQTIIINLRWVNSTMFCFQIMFEFVVCVECSTLFKCISTHGTLVWTLSCVDTLMNGQGLE